jgi:hypothetical protein
MAIILETAIGNPIRNTEDEILSFARLTTDVVQPSELTLASAFAADQVAFVAPESNDDRSDRSEPLRKRAEANLAASELWRRVATDLGLSTPPKQILTTLSISIGTDFPTQVDLLNAFQKVAQNYLNEGNRLLKMVRPITSTIQAGLSIDE